MLRLVTAPAEEPIALATAKTHLRVDATDDDALITSLIVAARQYAEAVMRRQLVTATWDLALDAWPVGDTITVPLPTLQSVASIKYKDSAGTEATMAATDYIVDTMQEPGRVVLAYGKSWPSVTLYPVSAVTVRFTAGYGAAATVPEAIRQAALLLIGHWYENREAVNVGNVVTPIPMAVDALLAPYRVLRWD